MNPKDLKNKNIVFYDGVCKFCNGLVQMLIKADKIDGYRFIALQSKYAESFLAKYNKDPKLVDTVYLIKNYDTENEKLFEESDAALNILSGLGGFWSIFRIGYILPKFFRDFLYKFQAKYRYKIFGKYEACRMPEKSQMHKFLGFDSVESY